MLSPPSASAFRLWPFHSGRKGDLTAPDKKRVLIMMSNTGGGHKASAEALKAVFREKYGDKFEVFIVDMWKEHTPPPFNSLPDTYSFMVNNGWIWRCAYTISQPKLVHLPYFTAVHAACASQLSQAFDLYQPDLVVSVHPLMQHVPFKVLRQRIRAGIQEPINFATVVTDFTTCHNTWFHRGVSKCFVPTEFARQLAWKQGLNEEQIVMHGLPIRPAFSQRLPPKRTLRRQLGLDLDVPAILLVGGGEGMGRLADTVDELARQLGSSCQVVVICGRNRRLLSLLSSTPVVNGMAVHARGFVDNLHEWMGAADAIITKAGPGTIAEALISGLPILLNGNVPCQEEGNIPFVVDNGVGEFETDPCKIASIIARWLGPDREEFEAMSRRSKALGRPEAVYLIVRDLAELAESAPTPELLAGMRRGRCLAPSHAQQQPALSPA